MSTTTQETATAKRLDAFTREYIACALWSSTDDEGEPLEAGDYELSDDAKAKMRADCADFIGNADVAALLSECGMSDEQAAHDFWLTRNRHGAGFWDRGLGDIGRKLTDLAHAWGSCDLYVGDDGLIYVS